MKGGRSVSEDKKSEKCSRIMKKILILLMAMVPMMVLAETTTPYFGKDVKGTPKAVQRCFKKTFKRPKGVNYDTSAKIHAVCVIDTTGHLLVIDPDLVTVEATVYSTVVETEHYNNIHGDTRTPHSVVMGADKKRGENEKSESELLREAVLEWLPTMPLWTPGNVDGQLQQMEVTIELEF